MNEVKFLLITIILIYSVHAIKSKEDYLVTDLKNNKSHVVNSKTPEHDISPKKTDFHKVFSVGTQFNSMYKEGSPLVGGRNPQFITHNTQSPFAQRTNFFNLNQPYQQINSPNLGMRLESPFPTNGILSQGGVHSLYPSQTYHQFNNNPIYSRRRPIYQQTVNPINRYQSQHTLSPFNRELLLHYLHDGHSPFVTTSVNSIL